MICSRRVKIQCPFRTHFIFHYFQRLRLWLISSVASRQKYRAIAWHAAYRLVPEAQPEISQTRSVWYHGKRKPVLKGQRNV